MEVLIADGYDISISRSDIACRISKDCDWTPFYLLLCHCETYLLYETAKSHLFLVSDNIY